MQQGTQIVIGHSLAFSQAVVGAAITPPHARPCHPTFNLVHPRVLESDTCSMSLPLLTHFTKRHYFPIPPESMIMSSIIKSASLRFWSLFRQNRDDKPQKYERISDEHQGFLDESSDGAKVDSQTNSMASNHSSLWRLAPPVMWMLGCVALAFTVYAHTSSNQCSLESSMVYCTFCSLDRRSLSRHPAGSICD